VPHISGTKVEITLEQDKLTGLETQITAAKVSVLFKDAVKR
jgi:hypothetical protein